MLFIFVYLCYLHIDLLCVLAFGIELKYIGLVNQ